MNKYQELENKYKELNITLLLSKKQINVFGNL